MLVVFLWSLVSHAPHEHGVVSMQIAVEGKQINFVLEGPAESFYGFEHEAKSQADKKSKNDAIETLKKKFSELVNLDASLKCKISTKRLNVVQEDEHSEVSGEWLASCEKSPAGTSAEFKFSKKFKRIQKMNVEVLSDQTQSKTSLKKADGRVKF